MRTALVNHKLAFHSMDIFYTVDLLRMIMAKHKLVLSSVKIPYKSTVHTDIRSA